MYLLVCSWNNWGGSHIAITNITFGRDDTLTASISDDCTMRVWDVASGKELPNLLGRHTKKVLSVAFVSDGQSIISASDDGSVINRDLEDPIWYQANTNWIMSQSTNDRLMWAPLKANIVARSNCRVMFGESDYGTVTFNNTAIGPNWAKCYTGEQTIHAESRVSISLFCYYFSRSSHFSFCIPRRNNAHTLSRLLVSVLIWFPFTNNMFHRLYQLEKSPSVTFVRNHNAETYQV